MLNTLSLRLGCKHEIIEMNPTQTMNQPWQTFLVGIKKPKSLELCVITQNDLQQQIVARIFLLKLGFHIPGN